jgi:hypothetical protein
MSEVRLTFAGLDELRAALRDLPDALTGDAKTIVLSHGDRAAANIQMGYPVGPSTPNHEGGNLKAGVRVRTLSGTGRFYAGVEVQSRAPHAKLYEFGTAGERSFNGANRGQMPPAPADRAFLPELIRERRAMEGDFVDLLSRAGLDVSGGGE